jgi:hypothetical protein
MKQFLVPALLLALVASTAAIAAGSRSCPPSDSCPFDDERCFERSGARCEAAAAEHPAAQRECCRKMGEAKCKEEMGGGCCKKKDAPAEKQ